MTGAIPAMLQQPAREPQTPGSTKAIRIQIPTCLSLVLVRVRL